MNIIEKVSNLIGYRKVPNYNMSLRGFLCYLTLSKEDFKKSLNNYYTSAEKNRFIYNCAIISINDFFAYEHYYINSKYGTAQLNILFDENFKLRQFDDVEVSDVVPANALDMIEVFKGLLDDDVDRQSLMTKSRELLMASA